MHRIRTGAGQLCVPDADGQTASPRPDIRYASGRRNKTLLHNHPYNAPQGIERSIHFLVFACTNGASSPMPDIGVGEFVDPARLSSTIFTAGRTFGLNEPPLYT